MIRFFVQHPTAANLLMVILLAMGLFSLPTLQRATFPEFKTTTVEVRVAYPGATALDIEDAICRRVENALNAVENVAEIRSEARDNVGIVTLEMKPAGDPADFLADVKAEVDAIREFPSRAEAPTVRPLMRTDDVVSISVAGAGSPAHLKAYAEDLRDRIQSLPEVSLVKVQGFGQRQIRISVNPSLLMQYGLSVEGLAQRISSQSLDLPAGILEAEDRDLVIRFTDERRTPRSFEDLVIIGGPEGAEVRLGEIAQIYDTFDPPEQKILFAGRRAAVLKIEKTSEEDTLTVFGAVRDFVEAERTRTPEGLTLALTQDQASVVEQRLTLLTRNAWQGLLLVVLVMWLFFGLRYSFWVAMGLPVSFLGAFFFLPMVGMTINMLTMVALLMALGLLMDDAIVLAENIAKELESGKNHIEATVAGVRGVAAGVLSSFLTTLAVFTPLAFIEGDIGKVLRAVPIVLILVLAVSLIEAFLILPHHLAHTRSKQGQRIGFIQRHVARLVAFVRERVLGPVVDFAVSFRYLTAGLAIAMLMFSVAMLGSGIVKFQAFPRLDGDVAVARVLMPAGTPLSETERVVDQLQSALAQVNERLSPTQPDGRSLIRQVSVRFNEHADAKEQGPHVATVTVDLLSAEIRIGRVDDILNLWRTLTGPVPDAVAIHFAQPGFGPAGRPIEIRIHGPDLAELESAALEVESWLSRYDGVQNLLTDLRPGRPELTIRTRPGSRSLGLTGADLATQLRSSFFGAQAAEMQVGTEAYEVDVRAGDVDRRSALDEFRVVLPSGEQAPLESVATIQETRNYSRIARIDRKRTATVTGDVDTERTNTNAVLAQFREDLMPRIEERGLQVTFSGEAKEGSATQQSMIRALLIGLIGVFVLLSFHFRSYLEPITVMLAIPLALIGVILGHFLMGIPFTMPSMLGFASLAGVVVNDSILLVEFIKRRRREGTDVITAARGASRDRFRAIFLTSITTIVGLLPLLSETSMQAQILIPIATSIVFGMLASTVLVLIVIPALYAIFGDLGWVTREA